MKQLIRVPHITDKIRNAVSSQDFRCSIRNLANGSVEMLVYDEIGSPGTTSSAKGVASFLAKNRGLPVDVKINSPGGLAYDGITIHNSLVSHDGYVTVTIEGMAASAAAIIAMAGDWVRQMENASLMVHRAMGVAIGNVDAMDEAKQWLSEVDQQIAVTLAAKTGNSAATMLRLMVGNGKTDGTTFLADAALKAGMINKVVRIGGDGKRGGRNSNPRIPSDDQLQQIRDDARRSQRSAEAQRRVRELATV